MKIKKLLLHTLTYQPHKPYVEQQKEDLNKYIMYITFFKFCEQVKLIYCYRP